MASTALAGISDYLAPKSGVPSVAADKPPAQDDDSDVKDYKQQTGALAGRVANIASETKSKNEALEREAGGLKPPPTPEQIPYKAPQQTNPAEEWGSLAMLFATFGSLLTRKPMLTALTAATSVLDAYKKNDTAAADQAFKVWQVSTKNAMELANYQQRAYQQAMSNITRREQVNTSGGAAQERAAMAEMTALSHQFKDPVMLQLAQDRGVMGMQKELDRRETQQTKLEQQNTKLTAMQEKQVKLQELQADPEFQEMLRTGDSVGMLTRLVEIDPEKYAAQLAKAKASPYGQKVDEKDPAFKSQIDALGSYTQQPPTSYAMRTPYNQKLMAAVREKYPDFDPKNYAAAQRALNQFTGGPEARTVRSLNTVHQHIETLEKLGDDLAQGDLPAFNKLANDFAARTGQPAPTNWEAAKELVSNEIAKAVSGTNASALADRENLRKVLDAGQSPAQREESIGTFKDLIRGQLGSLEKQYEATTYRKDFDRFLSPTTAQFFGQREGTKGGAKPAAEEESSGGREAELNGKRIVVKDGKWVDKETGAPVQ